MSCAFNADVNVAVENFQLCMYLTFYKIKVETRRTIPDYSKHLVQGGNMSIASRHPSPRFDVLHQRCPSMHVDLRGRVN